MQYLGVPLDLVLFQMMLTIEEFSLNLSYVYAHDLSVNIETVSVGSLYVSTTKNHVKIISAFLAASKNGGSVVTLIA